MSILQKTTITISCDSTNRGARCEETFVARAEKLTEAWAEAREAGWYRGTGDKAYCHDDAVEMGLRVKKRTET